MWGLKQSEKRQVLRASQIGRLELEEDSSRIKEMVEAWNPEIGCSRANLLINE
jgi:hypothetical protein